MRNSVLTTAIIVTLVMSVQVLGVNIVANPGFETLEPTGGGWPGGFGNWHGDVSSIVTAEQGITPTEGRNMLKFRTTSHVSAGSANSSQIFQLLDMNPYADWISDGTAELNVSGYFNRVNTDSQTDNRFSIILIAYSGLPTQFPAQYEQPGHGSNLLKWSPFDLFSDSDVQTWEKVDANIAIPAGTSYVALELMAQENIYNDFSSPEFDGHYADNISAEVIPEPATFSLLGLSGLLLLRRRRN